MRFSKYDHPWNVKTIIDVVNLCFYINIRDLYLVLLFYFDLGDLWHLSGRVQADIWSAKHGDLNFL